MFPYLFEFFSFESWDILIVSGKFVLFWFVLLLEEYDDESASDMELQLRALKGDGEEWPTEGAVDASFKGEIADRERGKFRRTPWKWRIIWLNIFYSINSIGMTIVYSSILSRRTAL